MPERQRHDPISQYAVEAVVSCYREAASYLLRGEPERSIPFSALFEALPQGPIAATPGTGIEGPMALVRIGERNPRSMARAGLLMLRTFPLFGGHPFFDKNQKGGQEHHYIELYGAGILFHRIMVGAEPNETVTLLGDHHNLEPVSLGVEAAGRRTIRRGRREAIAESLALYDRNAEAWGLSTLLIRQDYEALLHGVSRLFDRLHGHHYLRPMKGLAA